MKHAWLFDIDGVLCEPQQTIKPEMVSAIYSIRAPIYFVTGNGFVKTIDMLGGVDDCLYNGLFINNADEMRGPYAEIIWQDTETPPLPDELSSFLLRECLEFSPAKNQMEWRSPRFVNVCAIGRYAVQKQRDIQKDVTAWKNSLIKDVTLKFIGAQAVIGGQVSVDIYSKGADKSRAGKWLNDNGYTFTFIGDKTDPGGNDYPLAQYCEEHPENKWFKSTGPNDTLRIIKELV